MEPTDTAATPRACLNCGAALGDPRPRFCAQCGQETNVKPPTLGEFIQQFGGAYLSTEGALWRTLALLLFQPGELTRRYLAGRRKHYVLPLRLYLTVSVVTLLVVRSLAGVSFEPDFDPNFRAPRQATIQFGPGKAGLKDGKFFCEDLPHWLCKRLQRRIDVDPKALQQQVKQLGERFVANLGATMFVLLPSFALWLKLCYWSRRMRYTEHLVFALHLHAFWFGLLWLTLPDQPWLSALAVCAVPIYPMLALKRVYGGRLWPRLLRAGAISMLYGLTLGVALAGLALWTLLF